MRFGMWQGDSVLEELRPFYGTTVRDLVVKQVLDLSDSDLADFVKAPPAKLVARTHLPYWEALKLHLLLTSPREEGEPPLDEATQEWMLARITRPYFARALAENSEEGQALRAHAATYLRLLAQDPGLALPRDGRLVERSRTVLRGLPLADLALERVIAAAGQQVEDITLNGLLGGTLPEYTSKARVRAAFSKRAYTGNVGALLKTGMKDTDGWVLAAPNAAGSTPADLESAYFKAYIAEWRSFLESIELQPMTLLRKCAAVAATAHAPFITNASPEFFGPEKSFLKLPNLKDLKALFESPQYARWQSFRESEDARYVGLCMPRFLLRLPYGENQIPVKAFNFTEDVVDSHDKYLWAPASLALTTRISDSFAKFRWGPNIIGPQSGGSVENLPLHQYQAMGALQTKIPTEISLTERREYELSEEGFIGLTYQKDRDNAAFFSANSTQKPKLFGQSADGKAAETNFRLGTQLPYMATGRRQHEPITIRKRIDKA